MQFIKADLQKLFVPAKNSNGEDNGQITIIGGSDLFHGAPILSLTAASRIVDMVFFSSPEKSVGFIAENLKSKLLSFIWVPWNEIENYIEKSDAILIGPGFMRYSQIFGDETYHETKRVTEKLLVTFRDKRWVIDAGSLQTIDPKFIPPNAILTPNKKEFEILFGEKFSHDAALKKAKEYNCVIVVKGPITYVFNNREAIEVEGGNAGMTKGGTGDTQAGLTVALLAKNEPMLASCAASYIIKATADELEKEKGIYYNADDLATKIPEVLNKLIR